MPIKLCVGSKVLLSRLFIPKFEFELETVCALSGDSLSTYVLDVRRYGHVFLFFMFLGTNSNLNMSDPAHILGSNLVFVSMNIHRSERGLP